MAKAKESTFVSTDNTIQMIFSDNGFISGTRLSLNDLILSRLIIVNGR